MDPAVKAYFRRISKLGGKARAAKLTAKERSEAARKAVKARWAKEKKGKPSSR
jgi:hypothetical protein